MAAGRACRRIRSRCTTHRSRHIAGARSGQGANEVACWKQSAWFALGLHGLATAVDDRTRGGRRIAHGDVGPPALIGALEIRVERTLVVVEELSARAANSRIALAGHLALDAGFEPIVAEMGEAVVGLDASTDAFASGRSMELVLIPAARLVSVTRANLIAAREGVDGR